MAKLNKKTFLQATYRFFTAAVDISHIPKHRLPEIAFIGRSNCGKSSLINSFTGQKGLAISSKTPGRTRKINFFQAANILIVADLPGYGYAKVSKAMSHQWQDLIVDYLLNSKNLRLIYILIDARRSLKENDKEIMALLDKQGVAYKIILTKADKVKKPALERIVAEIEESSLKHPAMVEGVIFTSALGKIGIDKLRNSIFDLIEER
jgi:GTP-binding protein